MLNPDAEHQDMFHEATLTADAESEALRYHCDATLRLGIGKKQNHYRRKLLVRQTKSFQFVGYLVRQSARQSLFLSTHL